MPKKTCNTKSRVFYDLVLSDEGWHAEVFLQDGTEFFTTIISRGSAHDAQCDVLRDEPRAELLNVFK